MFNVPGVEMEVVEIARVAALLRRYPRAERRLFTAGERAYCAPRRKAPQHYTARLAAKIAARRALGGGMLGEFEVLRDEAGAPSLRLSGRAADLSGGCGWLLSLSHDAGVAVAVVAKIEAGR